MSVKYTGRRIAIISGCYGLIEPLEAIFNDIKHLGITEIYSLGNNIGYGPDSSVVIDMIEYAGIKSVVGEFEKYCILGDIPYDVSMRDDVLRTKERVITEIGGRRIDFISGFPYSYDLEVGGKNIGLCCFADDIRIGESLDTEVFLKNVSDPSFYQRFFMTNSKSERNMIECRMDRRGYSKTLASVLEKPIFSGEQVGFYKAIIQGNIDIDKHFYCSSGGVDFYTFGSVISFDNDMGKNIASYTILHERRAGGGFDVERRSVLYNRYDMEKAIVNAGRRCGKVRKLFKKSQDI